MLFSLHRCRFGYECIVFCVSIQNRIKSMNNIELDNFLIIIDRKKNMINLMNVSIWFLTPMNMGHRIMNPKGNGYYIIHVYDIFIFISPCGKADFVIQSGQINNLPKMKLKLHIRVEASVSLSREKRILSNRIVIIIHITSPILWYKYLTNSIKIYLTLIR